MKNKALAITLISAVFLLTLDRTIFFDFASAQLFDSPRITVESPVENRTYTTSNVNLKFNVKPVHAPFAPRDTVVYQLDRERAVALGEEMYYVDTVLENLPNGEHDVTIYAATTYEITWGPAPTSDNSVVVSFFVEKAPPQIRFVSGQQQTFDSEGDVSFNFTAFEEEGVSWLGYSLDGEDVVTVTDNVTATVSHRLYNYQLFLDGLSDGAHTLTVYAKDLAGNTGESEPLQFTVGEEAQSEPDGSDGLNQNPEPFPIALVAYLITIAVAAVVLLTYLKKRGRQQP